MKLLYIDLFCGAGGTSTGINARMNGEQRIREQAAAEACTWEEYREKYAVTNPFERK